MNENNIKAMSMKKTFILITLCLVAFCCPVEAQHLKFMGIPLNGTITQFQQKLSAKGVKYDKAASQQLPSGVRAYHGSFAGEKANIYVYYDPKSKVIYRAKAVISYPTEAICDSHYNEFKSLLSSKYPDAYTESGYQDEHETYLFVVSQNGIGELRDIHGSIGIYVSKDNIFDYYERSLHIDYTDYLNSIDNDNSKMKDL
jgi:hypothetical protein